MKNILSLILALFALFSLVSCSASSGGSNDGKTPIGPSGNIAVNVPDTVIMSTESFTVTDKTVTYHLYELYLAFCDSLDAAGFVPEDFGITDGVLLSKLPCSVDDSVNTWLEFFANQAEYNLTEQLVLCEAAKNAGIVLTDEDKAEIDGAMNELYEKAHKAGKAENAYIAELYGGAVNAGDIRHAKELSYLAEKYLRQVSDSADTSRNVLENYYAQYSDRIDTADFLVYVFSAGDDKYAQELASFGTAEEFLDYTRYHAVSVKGLTEDAYAEILEDHVICTNVHRSECDSTTDVAFSGKTGDVRLTKDENSGAVTVVMVTRAGSRNEEPNADGIPSWEADVISIIEAEAVTDATKAAAKAHPVSIDKVKFYNVDVKA